MCIIAVKRGSPPESLKRGVSMGKEYEMKYALTEPQARSLLELLQAEPCRELHMETTYYDTPGGALSARRITLRRRMENNVSVCTVKTPLDGFGRGEWETQAPCVEDAMDTLFSQSCPELLPLVRQEGVVPVCGARFTRICRTMVSHGACTELALDRGVLLGGGKEQPLLEFEVELKSGAVTDGMAAAEELARTYGLKPEPLSKFRRALTLAKGE